MCLVIVFDCYLDRLLRRLEYDDDLGIVPATTHGHLVVSEEHHFKFFCFMSGSKGFTVVSEFEKLLNRIQLRTVLVHLILFKFEQRSD